MKQRLYLPLLIWFLALMASGWVVLRHLQVTTDLSAFLPSSMNTRQQLLLDQLHDGIAARMILVGLTGNNPAELAKASRNLAVKLKSDSQFTYLNNGDADLTATDVAALKRFRYLLSPRIRPGYFSASNLHGALQDSLSLLGSSAGDMLKDTLPADPTGEMTYLAGALMGGGGGPHTYDGLWFSPDEKTALIIIQTRAAGFDIAAQQKATGAIRAAMKGVAPGQVQLLMTGPGVFAAESQALIEHQSGILTLISGILVVLILFAAYRSIPMVLMSMAPAVSGLLVGVALVQLIFGSVHGITLGFAAILMGEAVDYPSYLLTHILPGERAREALRRIAPTLRMAVLTTVIGSLPMLLSPLSGLAQLGVLAATGVLVAGLVTHFVMPALIPSRFAPRGLPAWLLRWPQVLQALPYRRLAVAGLALASIGWLGTHATRLWDADLAHMSPMPESMNQLDQQLRAELGAPDVRYLVAIRAGSQQQALQYSEHLVPVLQSLVNRKVIGHFEMAAQYLPSQQTQAARRAALPPAGALQGMLTTALQGMPFRAGVFTPFLQDVAQTKNGPPLTLADLNGTGIGLKVQSLLQHKGNAWYAFAPVGNVRDAQALQQQIEQLHDSHVLLLDIAGESNQMINHYRAETLKLTFFGLLLIGGLLWLGLRRSAVVGRVLFPVLAAVLIEAACLNLAGEKFSIFHLVSILLVIGVGLNYALFFNLVHKDAAHYQKTMLSLTVCSLTALSSFLVLSFSATPVLHAIGLTVSAGVFLSIVMSAWMAPPVPSSRPPADPVPGHPSGQEHVPAPAPAELVV